MATWKIDVADVSEAHTVEYTSFLDSRKFFAVDASGSTSGSIIKQERAFVDATRDKHPHPADTVSLWGSDCDPPTRDFNSPSWNGIHGGTSPTRILKGLSLEAIRESDVWFLLTDGYIDSSDVHRLAEMALELDVLNVPLVFLITGSCYDTPGHANISVGISFFASSQDTLILFKETQTGKLYVIAGKGCFAGLVGSAAAQNLETWGDLETFDSETAFFEFCEKLDIRIPTAKSRGCFPKGISLGPQWEHKHNGPIKVDLDLLLTSGMLGDDDLYDLLAEEAFDTLAIACKTRRRISDLRTLVRNHKTEQAAPKLEDVSGAATILFQLGDSAITSEKRKVLQEQLREAHVKNREHYHRNFDEFVGSPEEQRTKKRNRLVDTALQSLAAVEAAGFNADVLGRKSNRARRAEVVNSAAAANASRLDLEVPAFKGFCLVCCGEEEIMSICLKQQGSDEVADNTSDFALNFPLAIGASESNVGFVSSQNICFQCALLSPSGRSIYNESVTAIIPTVQYENSNKSYINDQLYLALTARLSTGAAGIGQLFMAVLLGVLRTKSWAKGGSENAQQVSGQLDEATQREKTFEWMLDQLVQNTRTRETFNENGGWVKFPEALAWTAKDFESNGLASFAVTYPAAGFENLIALGQKTGAYSNTTVRQLRAVKVLHSITSKYLADLQQNSQAPRTWKQKYLETIYRDFNGALIPRDQGSASLVDDAKVFAQRLEACLDQTSDNYAALPTSDQATLMPKIQLLLFWLIFKQRNHCTAQTFFAQARELFPLAPAILSPTLPVPDHDHLKTLLSLFATQDAQLADPAAAAAHHCVIPFANPFGASVLRCGAPPCNIPFSTLASADDLTPRALDAIRTARTRHLIAVFGVAGRFETSQTGLPERPDVRVGAPPSSLHSNMHVTIVRAWAALDVEARRAVVGDETARDEFVARVCEQLCENGRGDIFNAYLQRDVRSLLPSFFDVLARALRVEGGDEGDVAVYEHRFDENGVEDKIRWEMRATEI
jgi:hypothetical protein